MAKEIEKKYLLKYMPLFPKNTKHCVIVQAYIHVDKEKQIRVRKITTLSGITYTLCIKYMGKVRDEYEYEIPKKDGEELIKKSKHKFKKTRHSYTLQGLHYDFDSYNNGLNICEIEFPSNGRRSAMILNFLPDFLGKCIDGVHEYCNYYFAGIPEKDYM